MIASLVTAPVFLARPDERAPLRRFGQAAALFAALHALVDLRGHARWVRWIAPVASQPLVAYLIPFVVVGVEDALGVGFPDALDHGVGGVGFCVVFTLFVLGATAVVTRRVKLQL